MVELVVVIIIIGLLAAIGIVAYNTIIGTSLTNRSAANAVQVSRLYQSESAATRRAAEELNANWLPGVGETQMNGLSYAEDLPPGVTSIEVAADGMMTVTIKDTVCTGMTFSTVHPGESPIGEWDCAVTAYPAAPDGVSAVAGAGEAAVSWLTPVSSGASAITGYEVTSLPGGETCTSAGLSCTVTGLTPGQAYTFTVTATNTDGQSDASAQSEPVTPT